MGPQWDALAVGEKKEVFLVEAKANIEEIVSPGTGASRTSKSLIRKSLQETKEYLNIKKDTDWSGTFYQYTNRLAHLYFLWKNKVKAYLLFIYFIGDSSFTDKYTPGTRAEWEAALLVMKTFFGVKQHKLNKFIMKLFIDVKDIGM